MKFQKHISLFLAFFLLLSNMGLAFNVHYCGNEVSSVEPVYLQFNSSSKAENCCDEKIEKENSCCHDIIFQIQEKSENVLLKSFSFQSTVVFLKENPQTDLAFPLIEFPINSVVSYGYVVHAPPLFKLYHQYIFYG